MELKKYYHNSMKKFIYILIGLLFIGGVIFLVVSPGRTVAGKYDSFAKCIDASGAKFYGAFWCPHCQAQKAMFGNSVKYLPYIECSTPDGTGQTQVCIDKGITTYPTWYFSGTTTPVVGTQELASLASSTGCSLPQ